MEKISVKVIHYFDQKYPTADIVWKNTIIAEIKYAKGEFIISIYLSGNTECSIPLQDLLSNLELAKHRLLKTINLEKSLFGLLPDSPEEVNNIADAMIQEITSNPKSKTFPNRFNGTDIFDPTGRGVRIDSENNFLGFLQARGTE